MDGGDELANNGDVQKLLAHHGYTIRPTYPSSSFQNAPGERPHQDIGVGLKIMLRGANLENKFWPFARRSWGTIRAIYRPTRLRQEILYLLMPGYRQTTRQEKWQIRSKLTSWILPGFYRHPFTHILLGFVKPTHKTGLHRQVR
jgi:hypothetical protein